MCDPRAARGRRRSAHSHAKGGAPVESPALCQEGTELSELEENARWPARVNAPGGGCIELGPSGAGQGGHGPARRDLPSGRGLHFDLEFNSRAPTGRRSSRRSGGAKPLAAACSGRGGTRAIRGLDTGCERRPGDPGPRMPAAGSPRPIRGLDTGRESRPGRSGGYGAAGLARASARAAPPRGLRPPRRGRGCP